MLPIIFLDLTIFIAVTIGILGIFFFGLAFSLPSKKRINFKGKHVLVTGGSKGIGKQIAIESIKKGGNVSIIARNVTDLKNTCDELNKLSEELKNGAKAFWYSADMSDDYKIIEKVIRESEDKCGPVDILINNAGVSTQATFDNLPIEAFDKQMKLNYLSCVYATRVVIDNMKKRKSGHIGFVCSAAGQCAIWGYTAYSPSKFAVRGFAEALNMELLPFNIGITVVYPPNTKTEGFERECIEMPEELQIIGSSAGTFEPSYVAQKFVEGIENGEFAVNIGLDGWMLGHLTSGGSPENNIISAATQIFFNGIFRGILLFYIGHFNRIVARCKRKRETTE
uniref:3-dehydrosphinganine reductase n=1 Tax=Parastrongyloides trichosuri TaxID=131310 RepID=A0A0N4ZYX4_PARTI